VIKIKGDVSGRYMATLLLSEIYIQRIYEQKRQHRPSTERYSNFHKNKIGHCWAVSFVVSGNISFSVIGVLIILVMLLPALYLHMWGGVRTNVLGRHT
jgi:hypothetical protein